MKRKLLILLIALLAVTLSFTACFGGKEEEKNNSIQSIKVVEGSVPTEVNIGTTPDFLFCFSLSRLALRLFVPSCRVYERFEKLTRIFVVSAKQLRVPLHSDKERMLRVLDRLDRHIVGKS